MKTQSFEYQLQRTIPPAPDPEARLSARRAAVSQFERIHAQRSKPIATTPVGLKRLLQSHRFLHASWLSRNAALTGIATACVVVIGVSIVWLLPLKQREAHLPVPVVKNVQPVTEHAQPAQEHSEVAPASAQPAEAEEQTESRSTADIQPRQKHKEKSSSRVARVRPSPPQAEEIPTPQSQPSAPEQAVQTADAAVASVEGQRVNDGAMNSQAPAAVLQSKTNDNSTQAEIDDLSSVVVTGSKRRSRLSEFFSRRITASATPAPVLTLPSESRDKFQHFDANPVKRAAENPVSTFSVDVDTASYSFVRRQLNEGALPQVDAVRVEEMINYFDYGWPMPESREQPFKPTVTISDSPWGAGKKLIHIGIKGYALPVRQQPDVNLVLLLDVSGSMSSPDKLPLAQQSMALLLESLKPTDTVAIVVYAGAAGEVLGPTLVQHKQTILRALNSLTPGGSTAGAEGIKLAYRLAEESFRKGGVNRILLATDGDFNVGITDENELKGFVEREREKGVYLSVLGFGEGNYRDEMAQALAQNGNGVAAYIDTLSEANKVLVQESTASLFPIAKDVKLQIEFNPATVAEYRLVGYETRALNREDFNNDKVDAGDVGSGHTVTAIYEITPVGSNAKLIDDRRYSEQGKTSADSQGKANEYGFLKIRYKLPNGLRSRLLQQPILIDAGVPAPLKADVEFSTAVAGFAQLLRGDKYTGPLSFEDVIRQAQGALGEDPHGYRAELVQLVQKARRARGM